ncbi:MAG: hypothetical protein GF364_19350 [Candidatus Lokiarchaeota archaeon]|nr:hypothetical protein [Candidatus Lokiarchaeota archaeon]
MIFVDIDFATTPYRPLYIALNFLISYLSLQMAFLFLTKTRKTRKKDNKTMARIYSAFTILFTGATIITIIIALKRYWNYDPWWVQKFIYVTMCLMIFIFTAVLEHHYIQIGEFKSKHFFTIWTGILFMGFLLLNPESAYIWVLILAGIVPLLIPVLFAIFLVTKTAGTLRKRMILLIFSTFFLYIGIALSMDTMLERIPSEIFLIIGMILMLLSLNGVYLAWYRVDVVAEAGWQNHLETLFIIRKLTHNLIYSLDLTDISGLQNKDTSEGNNKKINKSKDESFITGGIIGIDSLIKSISESKAEQKGLKLIEQENKYIFLEHGVDIITCLITNKNLNTYRYYLRTIRNLFETFYVSKTIDWSNLEQSVFAPMEQEVKKILNINK